MNDQMPQSFKTMEEVLNLAPAVGNILTPTSNLPVPVPEESLPAPVVSQDDQELESDIQYARTTIREMIKESSEAVSDMRILATSSEHPRAFEVLATLIRSTSDMAANLVKLHDTRKNSKQVSPGAAPTTVNNNTQNIVMTGSPAEIIQRLKESRNGGN